MKALSTAAIVSAAMLTLGTAQAEDKQSGPGTTGEMNKVAPQGVATDPGGVKAQQQGSAKTTSGTVGVAPTGDPKDQKNK